MRVLTWNLWWRFGEWEKRQPAIEATLRSAGADIIAVQETWPEQLERFADLLDMHWAYSGRRPSDDVEHGFGNGILSRSPIVDSDEATLPALEGPAYRSILHARTGGPTPTSVFTTHLAHRYDESPTRCAQLEAASGFVEEHAASGDGAPLTLLLGDLNAVPDSDEVRRLTGRATPYRTGTIWSDAWEQVGEGSGRTWSTDNPHAAGSTWPNRRIDYVLTRWPRPSPTGNPIAASLIGRDPVDGVIPSDHWGVLVDLHD